MTYFLVFILVVLILLIWMQRYEGFTSKQEKAKAIKTWFDNNDKPEYARYKEDIPHSDVLEYTHVKKLGGNRDTSAIESLIS